MNAYLRELTSLALPEVVILDVGAMQDGEDCYASLGRHAKVIGVEPDPVSRSVLESRNPHNIYLPFVLGDGGAAVFHQTHYPGCSSIFEPDPNIINQFVSLGAGEKGNFAIIHSEPVMTKRLDEVDGLPPIDFIKLDVQGGELDILRHAARALSQACVLQVEVEFAPLYKGQPLFSDIDVFLREQGFFLHKFVDVAGRSFRPLEPLNMFSPYSQLLWADAVYVSSLFSPAEGSDASLLKSALILNDMYGSHDLVYRLLAELDRRWSTAHGLEYLTGLKQCPGLAPKFLNIKDYA